MLIPNVSTMYKWLNNFFPGVQGESQDYLQIGRQSDGTIVGWIDEEGRPQGTLVPAGILAIQASLLAIDTELPQTVVNNNVLTSLYNIAINMESRGDGPPGSTIVATILWSPVQGGTKSVSLVLDGNTDNIQQENYVMLASAGTTITVSTAFSGTPFHYDIAVSVILLPIGQ